MLLRAALREFRRPRLWLGIWYAGLLLCIGLSLVHPPKLSLDVPDGDKIGHFLAYMTLSIWSVLLFARTRSRLAAALALVLLGVCMEIAQGTLTSDRMMDLRDALANTAGVFAGQLLALSHAQTLLQRWDRRLFR